MKLLSRSVLVAAVLAASFLATVGPGSAYADCALASPGVSGMTTSSDPAGGFWATSPDTNALGVALGGLGAIAALLTGGALLVRQRWLTQAALETGADPGLTVETETVLLSEPAEIESEVALAYRR